MVDHDLLDLRDRQPDWGLESGQVEVEVVHVFALRHPAGPCPGLDPALVPGQLVEPVEQLGQRHRRQLWQAGDELIGQIAALPPVVPAGLLVVAVGHPLLPGGEQFDGVLLAVGILVDGALDLVAQVGLDRDQELVAEAIADWAATNKIIQKGQQGGSHLWVVHIHVQARERAAPYSYTMARPGADPVVDHLLGDLHGLPPLDGRELLAGHDRDHLDPDREQLRPMLRKILTHAFCLLFRYCSMARSSCSWSRFLLCRLANTASSMVSLARM